MSDTDSDDTNINNDANIKAGGSDLTMAFQLQTVDFMQYVQSAGFDLPTTLMMITDGITKILAWQLSQVSISINADEAVKHKAYIDSNIESYKAELDVVLGKAKEILDAKINDLIEAKKSEEAIRQKGENIIPFPTHHGTKSVN
jgi:hypothetical protein